MPKYDLDEQVEAALARHRLYARFWWHAKWSLFGLIGSFLFSLPIFFMLTVGLVILQIYTGWEA